MQQGKYAAPYDPERYLFAAVIAVGLTVMSDLYERMRNRPEATDLAKLWQDLGIDRKGESLDFRDDAPFASEATAR